MQLPDPHPKTRPALVMGNIQGLPPTTSPRISFEDRLAGMLFGLAIGDALGLPVETLSAQQIEREFGLITDYLPLNRNPFFPKSKELGLISDDTQLSIALAEAVLRSGGLDVDSIAAAHVEALQSSTLGWGKSTKEAVANLARGVHWSEASKTEDPKRGTGNGVAMKVAPIAAYLVATNRTLEEVKDTVAAIATMTHRTSMAVSSGFAHIAAVMYCLTHTPENFQTSDFMSRVIEASKLGENYLPETLGNDNLTSALCQVLERTKDEEQAIAQAFGNGSCYVFHSLPFSYCNFLRSPFGVESLYRVVSAGGDTDSNGSMVGALLGALHGVSLFPESLTKRVQGSVHYRELASRMARLQHLGNL